MKFIFLVYESRSGSTMLARTLASRTVDVLVLPELRLIEVLLAEGDAKLRGLSASELFEIIQLDHQLRNLELSAEQIMAAAKRAVGQGVVGIVEEVVSSYAASRGMKSLEYVVVKSGGLLYLVRDLERLFPGCHLLHIYRDVRGVVNSVIHNKRPYFPGELMGRGDSIFMARSWAQFVDAAAAVRHTWGHRFVEIAYEDLCSRPEEAIGEVLGQLGVQGAGRGSGGKYVVGEAERSIHRLVDKDPIVERLEAWKTELEPWQGVAIETVARGQMAKRGYEAWFSADIGVTRKVCYLVRAWCSHYWRSARYYLARVRYYSSNWAKLSNRLKLHRLTKADGKGL